MGIFTKKEEDKKKESDVKSAKVDAAKKDDSKASMKDLYSDDKKSTTPATKAVKKDDDKAVKKEAKTVSSGRAYAVLVKPLITEKATNLGTENQYVFEVAVNANKIEVAKAINEVYKVKPISVNIIKMKGKRTRYGRTMGSRKDWKKAIVTLKKGDTIQVYEGV